MSNFIGDIRLTSYDLAPTGWAKCDGSILNILDHPILFALIGTSYGGDGVTTFALPDTRGRALLGVGTPAVIDSVHLGNTGGVNRVNLVEGNLPSHSHDFNVLSGAPGENAESDFSLANGAYYGEDGSVVVLDSGTIGNTGSGTPVSVMQPYLGVGCIIALTGADPRV